MLEIIVAGLVLTLIGLLVLFIIFRGAQHRGVPLTLRTFWLASEPDTRVYVRLNGRPAGLVRGLFGLLGVDEETSLEVSRSTLSFKTATLAGDTRMVVPLQHVSCVRYGESKNIWFAMAAVVFFFVGMFFLFSPWYRLSFDAPADAAARVQVAASQPTPSELLTEQRARNQAMVNSARWLGIWLVGASVCWALVFMLSRKLEVHVETEGGYTMSARFTRGLVEDVSVDMTRLREMVRLITALVNQASVEMDDLTVSELLERRAVKKQQVASVLEDMADNRVTTDDQVAAIAAAAPEDPKAELSGMLQDDDKEQVVSELADGSQVQDAVDSTAGDSDADKA